jgi:hypothetical protein
VHGRHRRRRREGQKVADATWKFKDAQAHDMIDSFRGLLAAVDDIEKPLKQAVDVSIV